MNLIASATATSPAPVESFFERWADMPTWPEWSTDTEWVRLDGPCGTGATGRLKPKGGPAVRFTVTQWTPGERFVDVSDLLGARLTFDHTTRSTSGGGARIDVTVTLAGPLAPLWRRIMGAGIATSLQADLDRLVATVGIPA